MASSRRKVVPAVEPDLTRRQAATILNVGLPKLDELIRDGTLESYKLGKGRRAGRRIVRASVELMRRGQPTQSN